ncbi:hypothetical protein K501DRAFT_269497 [Backusella circina FSU 941]|nr:hypothetical protein K501DRAFT_269497 [Backusella circina FSU 941]
MSTINSYFKARKNKNTPVYISDKAKQHGLVVQAPEEKKIYHTSATKKQIHKEKPKGILRFMSPIKQQETEKEEKEEEEHIVCKIKKSTKLTDFWKDLVNNYDADSSLEEDCGKKRSHDDDTERNLEIRRT